MRITRSHLNTTVSVRLPARNSEYVFCDLCVCHTGIRNVTPSHGLFHLLQVVFVYSRNFGNPPHTLLSIPYIIFPARLGLTPSKLDALNYILFAVNKEQLHQVLVCVSCVYQYSATTFSLSYPV